MQTPKHPNPVTQSRQLVRAVTKLENLPRADGVHGKRHHSRGMFGFYEPKGQSRRLHLNKIGLEAELWYAQNLIDQGRKEEARAVLARIQAQMPVVA